MIRLLEELAAAVLLLGLFCAVGYGWLMHAEAQREGVVITMQRGE